MTVAKRLDANYANYSNPVCNIVTNSNANPSSKPHEPNVFINQHRLTDNPPIIPGKARFYDNGLFCCRLSSLFLGLCFNLVWAVHYVDLNWRNRLALYRWSTTSTILKMPFPCWVWRFRLWSPTAFTSTVSVSGIGFHVWNYTTVQSVNGPAYTILQG